MEASKGPHGNGVGWGNQCIGTDKVFDENPGISEDELLDKLQALLRVNDLIVIPREPYDEFGHGDGVVQFVSDGMVVINDYSKVASQYRERLTAVLRRARLSWHEIPHVPRDQRVNGVFPAFGCYVNFLCVGGLLVLPSYGIAQDEHVRHPVEDTSYRHRWCRNLRAVACRSEADPCTVLLGKSRL